MFLFLEFSACDTIKHRSDLVLSRSQLISSKKTLYERLCDSSVDPKVQTGTLMERQTVAAAVGCLWCSWNSNNVCCNEPGKKPTKALACHLKKTKGRGSRRRRETNRKEKNKPDGRSRKCHTTVEHLFLEDKYNFIISAKSAFLLGCLGGGTFLSFISRNT